MHPSPLAPDRPGSCRPRATAAPVVMVVAAIVLFGGPGMAPDATAQPEPAPCLDCGYELTVVAVEEEGDPGDLLRAIYRITNTGQGEDRYTIEVDIEEGTWYADVDRSRTGTLQPSQGALAGEGNSTLFNVSVAIPVDARANEQRTITVRVTSERIEGPAATKTETFTVRAAAFERWRLNCDARLTIQTAHEDEVRFVVENLGNIRRLVQVRLNATEGFVVGPAVDVDIEPGTSHNGTFSVGAGLRAQEGEHTLVMEVVREGDERSPFSTCETTVEVVSVSPDSPPRQVRNEPAEESPASGHTFLSVVGVAFLASLASRRRRAPPQGGA